MSFGQTSNPEEEAEVEFLNAGFRYAFSLTHHQQDAEDLVQQAWVALHRRHPTVKDKPLLFTSIRNLFYDRCRRSKIIRFESLEEVNCGEIHTANQACPGNGTDIADLLGRLESNEREALYLNHVEGYTATEIAQLTGHPRGTVLTLIFRAKKLLRKFVNGQERQMDLQGEIG